MSTATAAVGTNRSHAAMGLVGVFLLLACLISQGAGGALTTGIDPLVTAALILGVGTPFVIAIAGVSHGWRSMFDMGSIGTEERTRFLWLFRPDPVVLRWMYVVVIGATSVGINLGIAEADQTIGTGPRMAIQTIGTLLPMVLTFFLEKRWVQLIMRGALLGGAVFAVAVFSGEGTLDYAGLAWAGACGLHMFAVTKALSAWNTQAIRDRGMALGNTLALLVVGITAVLNDAVPTPDKFEGAILPWWVLVAAIPLAIMVFPVWGMNKSRSFLEEGQQAVWMSTGPVWGAVAALALSVIGWANPPAIDGGQWVGIGIVVLAAIGTAVDVTVHDKWKAKLREAEAERIRATQLLDQVIGERDRATKLLGEVTAQRDAANAKLREAGATLNQIRERLDAVLKQAESFDSPGDGVVTIRRAEHVVYTRGVGLRWAGGGGVTFKRGGTEVEVEHVRQGSVGADGRFTGHDVAPGTVLFDGKKYRFAGARQIEVDALNVRFDQPARISSLGGSAE